MNETAVKQTDRTTPRMRMLWFGLFVAIFGMVAATAWAQPMGHAMAHHHRGMGGPGMWSGSPAQIDRKVDRMLDGLNASDAQRAEIKQIAHATATDLKTQRQGARELRERGLQIFTAPTVDPAAAEALRQQMLARHDQASRRMMQAMLDVSRVLTPEQRVKFAERIQDRAARMHDRMERMKHDHGDRGGRWDRGHRDSGSSSSQSGQPTR